jgi:hypothetical protein
VSDCELERKEFYSVALIVVIAISREVTKLDHAIVLFVRSEEHSGIDERTHGRRIGC